MVIMYGRREYDIHQERAHDAANSTAADDVGVLTPPEDASGCLLSVESIPVRVTFDGENPTPSYGILIGPGQHFLAFAREIRFVSVHEQRQATVSVVWVRTKLAGHAPAE
jgi:hypothetical protein